MIHTIDANATKQRTTLLGQSTDRIKTKMVNRTPESEIAPTRVKFSHNFVTFVEEDLKASVLSDMIC